MDYLEKEQARLTKQQEAKMAERKAREKENYRAMLEKFRSEGIHRCVITGATKAHALCHAIDTMHSS